MKNVKMDKKQRERGKELKKRLEKAYDKVQIGYINLGYSNSCREICVDIYENGNEYDYKSVTIKFNPYSSVEEDIAVIKYGLENEKYYKIHRASPVEKMIIGLIKEYKCCELWINDGELNYNSGECVVGLDYVDSFSFNREEGIVELVEESGEKTIVDLIEDEMSWIDDEATEEDAGKIFDRLCGIEDEDDIDFKIDVIDFLNELEPYGEKFRLSDDGFLYIYKDKNDSLGVRWNQIDSITITKDSIILNSEYEEGLDLHITKDGVEC